MLRSKLAAATEAAKQRIAASEDAIRGHEAAIMQAVDDCRTADMNNLEALTELQAQHSELVERWEQLQDENQRTMKRNASLASALLMAETKAAEVEQERADISTRLKQLVGGSVNEAIAGQHKADVERAVRLAREQWSKESEASTRMAESRAAKQEQEAVQRTRADAEIAIDRVRKSAEDALDKAKMRHERVLRQLRIESSRKVDAALAKVSIAKHEARASCVEMQRQCQETLNMRDEEHRMSAINRSEALESKYRLMLDNAIGRAQEKLSLIHI